MNLEIFENSLSSSEPPQGLNNYLLALWHDGKGDWNKAHEMIQDLPGATASWIHAYLHRKEGDIGNADYWYSRAGKRRPNISLEMEWRSISEELLSKHHRGTN